MSTATPLIPGNPRNSDPSSPDQLFWFGAHLSGSEEKRWSMLMMGKRRKSTGPEPGPQGCRSQPGLGRLSLVTHSQKTFWIPRNSKALRAACGLCAWQSLRLDPWQSPSNSALRARTASPGHRTCVRLTFMEHLRCAQNTYVSRPRLRAAGDPGQGPRANGTHATPPAPFS